MKRFPLLLTLASVSFAGLAVPLLAQPTQTSAKQPAKQPLPQSTNQPVKQVTFSAKKSESPGNVLLIPVTAPGALGKLNNGKLLGPAVGTITVPGGSGLYLIVTPEGASRLACLKKLKSDDLWRVRLHDVPIAKDTYTCLSALTGMVDLDLSNSDVDDAGVKVLSKHLSKLRRLDLSRTVVRGGCFSSLSNCRELTELDLAANAIEDFVLSALPKSVPNLEKLDLSKTKITDGALEHVGKLKHLKKLKLSENSITDKGLTFLSKLSELGKIQLAETKVTQQGLATLRRALPGCKIDTN